MFIDLSQTLSPAMRGVEWEPARTIEEDGWNARILHLYSHCGTHMDAPLHFNCGDRSTIDEVPLTRMITIGHVVRIADAMPSELLTVEHLGKLSETFPVGDSLLMDLGWESRLSEASCDPLAFPRLSEELAIWCVENEVAILGVEPPSVADVRDLPEVTRIHEILLGGGVTIVEGLRNLRQLPNQPFLFGAMPLKVEGGDGAPCRAWASTTSIEL